MRKIALRGIVMVGAAAVIALILIFVSGATEWVVGLLKQGRSALPHLIAIFFLVLVGPRIWRGVLERAIHTQRLEIIKRLLLPIGNSVVLLVVFMIALDIFSIDVRPLLAGVGIVGLAIGFGTKNIIEDLGSGVFILWENQYMVGERVKIGTFEGSVLRLTLRMTFLQGEEGEISIPNRVVASSGVINYSRKKE